MKQDDLVIRDQYAQYYRDAASDARSSISGDDTVSDAKSAVRTAKTDKEADAEYIVNWIVKRLVQ
ncbi:hypothetical protein [Lacrimispora indolis]|uniref:hypothetical protein n=1 Tax=Lacrimispora indolis TaxID=69825 RepID=UPI00045EC2AC|nr:hypothetical protein [Lacrimispora indolis]